MTDFLTYNQTIGNINYHFVWVTKHIKKVLASIEESLKKII